MADADPDAHPAAQPAVTIDPSDFDAVGVMSEVLVALRVHAIEHGVDVQASVSAPPGRHRLLIAARPGGHVVLGVRFSELTLSRRNVLVSAFAAPARRHDWDTDEDDEGVTRRFPPGTEPTAIAFEALAVLTLGGVPPEPRRVTATDATGAPVPLG